MYANLFFDSENKVGSLFFSSDNRSAPGRENEAVYYSVTCSGEGREHITGYFMLEIKGTGPRGRGSLIRPLKPGSFLWGDPCGNNLETFPLPNDPGRGTIPAELRGTGRTDFHLDSSRLGERQRGNDLPTKNQKAFLRAGAAFSFVPRSSGSWVRPLCTEEKWVPLKRPVPRRLFPLSV